MADNYLGHNMQTHWFHTVWPFVGGGAAIVMVAILLTTDTFRSNPTVSRWRDAGVAGVASIFSFFDESNRLLPVEK